MTVENHGNEAVKENMIYFDNIKYGLDHYDNEIVKMGETEAFQFFMEKLSQAEKDSVYVDFYYGYLEMVSRSIVDKELTEEEQTYVQNVVIEGEMMYLLDEMLLQIVTKLNARETLFSTIYFTGEPEKRCTWWGNYNQEYIVFREKQK